MDVELLDIFDDEADQGYYEDETVTLEQLQEILTDTGPFSGGMPFEKLPGQVAMPMDGGLSFPGEKGGGSAPLALPGQLGKQVADDE